MSPNSHRHIRSAAAAILLSATMASSAAVAESPQESALTGRERDRIEAFLIDRFRAERISRDLVTIIMKRIDAAAVGERVPETERLHPATTSYPSVALQITWQAKLEKIAEDFRTTFNVAPPRRAPHPIMLDAPPLLPDLRDLHNVTIKAIREAQGEIGEELLERPLPPEFRFDGNPSAPRERIGRYTKPVRIAASGIALIDEAVPQALDEVRAEHPEISPDRASFPAQAGAANLLMPAERFDWSATDHVLACVRWFYCRTLEDLLSNAAAEGTGHRPEDSFAFLDTVYLTNPYGEGYGGNAIVQLDRDGAIAGSYCARREAGYQPALMGGPPVNRDHLRACLEAAMGY